MGNPGDIIWFFVSVDIIPFPLTSGKTGRLTRPSTLFRIINRLEPPDIVQSRRSVDITLWKENHIHVIPRKGL